VQITDQVSNLTIFAILHTFNPKTARLQFSVPSVFVHLIQMLLQRIQLGQSVIAPMSIGSKSVTAAQLPTRSEFRVAIAALIMAVHWWTSLWMSEWNVSLTNCSTT
jgi:hypothetical protein